MPISPPDADKHVQCIIIMHNDILDTVPTHIPQQDLHDNCHLLAHARSHTMKNNMFPDLS